MAGKNLEEAFTGFVSKWKDQKWRETIAVIINFYTLAITYPVPAFSVQNSFTALDRLASAYDPNIDSKPGPTRISSVLSHGNLITQSLPTSLHTFYDTFYKTYCSGTGKNADGRYYPYRFSQWRCTWESSNNT